MKKYCRFIVLFFLIASVSCIPVYSSTVLFNDISNTHWASKNITRLVDAGVASGYPDGNFSPEGTITYGEFIKLAVIAVTENDPGSSELGHWATNYYYTALHAGLFSAGEISQDMLKCPIVRGDMAIIAANAVDQNISQTENNVVCSYIIDMPRAENKKNAIVKAYMLGIISGYTDRTFQPEINLTRAEAVTVTLRIIDPKERTSVNTESFKSVIFSQKESSTVNYSDQTSTFNDYEKQILISVNEYRNAAGLPALKYNAQLSAVAEVKGKDLRDQCYFDHTSPIYGTPFDMMDSFGIKYSGGGENIAKGYKTPKTAMDAFMGSHCHKEAILEPYFTEIGIDYTIGADGIAYWVQLFIHP